MPPGPIIMNFDFDFFLRSKVEVSAKFKIDSRKLNMLKLCRTIA